MAGRLFFSCLTAHYAELLLDLSGELGGRPSRRRPATDFRLFQRLEAMRRPGLPEDIFRDLFSKCGVCGIITTRQVFSYHECCPEGRYLTDVEEDDEGDDE